MQARDIAIFAAKTQSIHTPQTVEDGNGAGSEGLCTGTCIANGQFQNEICAAGKRHACPVIFIQKGGRAALSEIAAHDHYDIIRLREGTR